MSHTIELGARDFLTSDLHLGGAPWPYKLWFPAKAGDPRQQMRDAMAKVWDYQVGEDSVVVLVGDAIDGHAADVEMELEWYRARPGRKILVPGNHDGPHPMNEGRNELASLWAEVFDIAPAQETLIKFDGILERIPACHYPNSEKRQALWRHERAEQDIPVLHGHTHSRKAESRTASGLLQVNIGWPAWRKLASAAEIADKVQTSTWVVEK